MRSFGDFGFLRTEAHRLSYAFSLVRGRQVSDDRRKARNAH